MAASHPLCNLKFIRVSNDNVSTVQISPTEENAIKYAVYVPDKDLARSL